MMVIKIYISGISASKEVKKRQQRAMFILDSLKVPYEAIDITEPGKQEENERFREVCKLRENRKLPLPPQFFNDDTYCGDWDDFFIASDDDTVLQFLHLEEAKGETTSDDIILSPVDQDILAPAAADVSEDQVVDEDLARKSVNGDVDGHGEMDESEETDSVQLPAGNMDISEVSSDTPDHDISSVSPAGQVDDDNDGDNLKDPNESENADDILSGDENVTVRNPSIPDDEGLASPGRGEPEVGGVDDEREVSSKEVDEREEENEE